MPHTPWIHAAGHPDTSTLERLVAHPRFSSLEREALAVELWKYTIDPDVGFYHYWSPGDQDGNRPYVDQDYVKDPLKLINSYGYMLCGTVAAVYANLCELRGMDAVQIGVPGHCLNEVFYEGEWHLIDCDLRAYHRRHDGKIAGLKDLEADPDLVAEPVGEKSEPYYVDDRPPANMAEMYKAGTGFQMPRFVQRLHTMDYILRPGEELTFLAQPVEDRWHFPKHYIKDRKKWEKQWTGKGPYERFAPHRTHLNGHFRYRPNLTDAAQLTAGAWSLDNLEATPKGLSRKNAAESARAVWLVHSPWVITGKLVGSEPEDKAEALVVTLNVELGAGGRARILGSIDGEHFDELAVATESGTLRADATNLFEARYRGLIAVELEGDATVRDLDLQTWFQLAPNAYPTLSKDGKPTTFTYHGLDATGTRTLTESWIAPLEDDFDAALVAKDNLKRGDTPHTRLSPVEEGRPWLAVFCAKPGVQRGRPIRRARLMAAVASVKGDPDQPPADYTSLAPDQRPRAKLEAAPSPDGPWTVVDDRLAPLHKEGWHFSVDGAYEPPQPAEALYVRLTADLPGWEVRAALACDAPETTGALDIEHVWTVGGAEQRHVQRIEDPNATQNYEVPATGAEATDVRVTFRA